jgi:outer membrane protein insertion porin family
LSAYHSVQSNGQPRKLEDPETGFTVSNANRQSLLITGGTVSYGKHLQKPDDWFLMYTGISYQYFDLNNYGSFFSFNDGYSNNLAFNFTLERNSISDPIYPTWGSKVTFTTKLTPPWHVGQDFSGTSDQEKYALVEYHKWKLTANWYTPLNRHKTRKLVLAANAGFGFLGAYNTTVGLAPFERFYLGGVFLSGFLLDGREIVNLRGYDDLSLTFPSDNVGAPVISKYGLELRYPLSTNPSATIYMLTFLEAGNTWPNFREYNPFNVYRSAGIGLRVFLPMFGMLGFDYGWRQDDVPNAPQMAEGQFHFSIGMNLGEL